MTLKNLIIHYGSSGMKQLRHETAPFSISIIIFLKSMRHLMKANSNKTSKKLRLWDSNGLKFYLFFTSIKICLHASMKVLWMFFKEIYSFMHSYYSYWMLFLLKNWEKLLIFLFYFIFSTPILYQALLICLQNSFSHSIPSMFHVSWSRDIRTRLFWSFKDLYFEKSPGAPQF